MMDGHGRTNPTTRTPPCDDLCALANRVIPCPDNGLIYDERGGVFLHNVMAKTQQISDSNAKVFLETLFRSTLKMLEAARGEMFRQQPCHFDRETLAPTVPCFSST